VLLVLVLVLVLVLEIDALTAAILIGVARYDMLLDDDFLSMLIPFCTDFGTERKIADAKVELQCEFLNNVKMDGK
jgi:hypothetical protein